MLICSCSYTIQSGISYCILCTSFRLDVDHNVGLPNFDNLFTSFLLVFQVHIYVIHMHVHISYSACMHGTQHLIECCVPTAVDDDWRLAQCLPQVQPGLAACPWIFRLHSYLLYHCHHARRLYPYFHIYTITWRIMCGCSAHDWE